MPTGTRRTVPFPAERLERAATPTPPAAFTDAVASLRSGRIRTDAVVTDATPPTRIAPFAAAVMVDLGETASGRLVYLHDPAGQQAWAGRDRLVAFARAEIDDDMAADTLLSDVVWAWLVEAMDAHGAAVRMLGGTVTTTASRRYGNLEHLPRAQEVELRCSWSPVPGPDGSADLGPHLAGLIDGLAAMNGQPPA